MKVLTSKSLLKVNKGIELKQNVIFQTFLGFQAFDYFNAFLHTILNLLNPFDKIFS